MNLESEELFDKIGELVKSAMKNSFNNENNENWPYHNIDDYKAKTGKKFRMTKIQKESGLTREQAFAQKMEKLVEKI